MNCEAANHSRATDAVTHAYLKALGRRIGVEVAVNTSFNVGDQSHTTPVQAIDTLRRAKAMDGVFMFSPEGPIILAWLQVGRSVAASRIPEWLANGGAKQSAEASP